MNTLILAIGVFCAFVAVTASPAPPPVKSDVNPASDGGVVNIDETETLEGQESHYGHGHGHHHHGHHGHHYGHGHGGHGGHGYHRGHGGWHGYYRG